MFYNMWSLHPDRNSQYSGKNGHSSLRYIDNPSELIILVEEEEIPTYAMSIFPKRPWLGQLEVEYGSTTCFHLPPNPFSLSSFNAVFHYVLHAVRQAIFLCD